MKKLLAMGTVVVLMLALAAPAFTQDAIADDDSVATTDFSLTVVDASQSQDVDVTQTNTGDVTATADDDSIADASIDQSLYVDQYQLNGGFYGYYDYYGYYWYY